MVLLLDWSMGIRGLRVVVFESSDIDRCSRPIQMSNEAKDSKNYVDIKLVS